MAKKRVRHHVNPLADLTEYSFQGFENNNPIIIDVGADHGEFIEGLLKKFSDEKNFIVFEIRKPLAEKLREKFSEYKNVIVFDGDANRNFENIVRPCLEKSEVEEIYVNFPDPWFKARHKKRRFVNEGFLQSIKDWMSSSTEWIFQTDQKKLFEDTLEVLENVGIDRIEFFKNSLYDLQTKWEKAKIKEDSEIYRMRFKI
ncbi:MAG: hypothetical protein KAT32_01940 [Candidatus Moranbacteria bacterium]|nr:hypothetical protein [Candidatus Moranbacteria bacterium]